ncbi:unnamed protein product [Ectocarpus sp. 6 AP-2014]
MARYGGLFGIMAMTMLSQPCLALVSTELIEESGVSATLVADAFGAAAGGYMHFEVEPTSDWPSNRVAYLVVVAESMTSQYFTTLLEMSDLEADDPPPVCAAPSAGRFEITGHDSFNMSIAHHDRYSPYLVVCDRGGSFYGHVTSTFLNRVPEGDLTQHLPINQAMLPALYTLMSVVYVALTAAWLGEMVRLRRHVLPVHSLCLACVVVKTVQFILRAIYFHRQSVHGGEGDRDRLLGAAVVLFIVLFQVVFLLTLLLFSLGWGFIRPSLRSKEGWLVTITIGFYAGVSLIDASCDDTNSSSWCSGVGLMAYAVRSLVMLTTVVAINFNITHIRFCIQQLPWTSSSALEYVKLSRYLSYRMTFLAYLLMPTVLLMVSVFILSWEYDWIYVALDEFVRFLIIAHLGVTFAPLDPWLLTRAFDHSLEQLGS